MGEISGWDAEVSAFVCPFSGRWPTQDESSPAAGAGSSSGWGRRGGAGSSGVGDDQEMAWFQPQLRWAKWDASGRTLEVGIGPAVAPRSSCLTIYIYLPNSLQAPPLLFAGERVPASVTEALNNLSERAAGKRTPLSVLVDQAVGAIEAGHVDEAVGWGEHNLIPSEGGFEDIAAEVQRHKKALDAFLCFAVAACRSLRRVSLLDPFPLTLLDTIGGRDFDACSQCLLSLPSLESLFGPGSSRRVSTQQGLLLRWLGDLKGVVVKGVRDATSVTEHAGRGDFVIELDHGDEPLFDAAAEAHGSVRGFHGSSLENFHCILRCGLKSFSGTKRMNTGDVYGEGVYLSSDYRLARSFAARGRVWPHSSLGTYVTCVACCRIALHPSIRRQKETAKMGGANGRPLDSIPHTYYVVPDPRYVRIESIIVIPDGAAVNGGAVTQAARPGAGGSGEAGRQHALDQGGADTGGEGWSLVGWVKFLIFLCIGWYVSNVLLGQTRPR